MKIYPNPTKSTAFVSIPSGLSMGSSLRITNKMGELIDEHQFSEQSEELIPIDLSQQPAGFYTISVSDECGETSYDLLKIGRN